MNTLVLLLAAGAGVALWKVVAQTTQEIVLELP
jgi:hypothetical protein